MQIRRSAWAVYSWTLDGKRLDVPAPDLASARVAAAVLVDERYRTGLLTERMWTAWQSRIRADRPERAAAE